MDIKSIIGISAICAMGAVSPGPSLAVVVKNTISGGRPQGVLTGIGHGIGLGIYAFIAVTGLSSLIILDTFLFITLQLIGAFIFIWIAYKMLSHSPTVKGKIYKNKTRNGFAEGFMIAFFNPKILVFFVAVFSQFMNPQISKLDRFILAGIAGMIDMTWYVFVAIVLAGTSLIEILKDNAILIDRLVGFILMIYSVLLIVNILIY